MKKIQILALAALLGVALSGCLQTQYRPPWAREYLPEVGYHAGERRQRAIASNPDWPADRQAQVAAGKVAVGMTKAQVLASWGAPKRRNSTGGRYGNREQWVYSLGSYLYFDDSGRLAAWQGSQ